MTKCVLDCTCGRHRPYPRTPEVRLRASEQMKNEWSRRQDSSELMAPISAAMSKAHESRWTKERREAVRATVGRLHTPEARAKKSQVQRGKWHGDLAVGHFVTVDGYRGRTGQYGHPLATTAAIVLEHRAVLYDKIGPGPHECHWTSLYGCDKSVLEWGGLDGICVDHLDDNTGNNDPDNLVPSCCGCNLRRGRESKLTRELCAAGLLSNNAILLDPVRYWQVRTQKG